MSEPLISVIIPIYNVEAYLSRCLDSVIHNTYKNLEIICVNDGSPDKCQEILDRYAQWDNRIKVIVQENGGVPAARNTGIAASSGDYLYYLDSDDWIHRQAMELLMRAAEKSGAKIIVGGRKESYGNDIDLKDCHVTFPDSIPVYHVEQAQSIGMMRSFVTGRLYKADFAKIWVFYDVPAGEDTAYNAMLMSSKQPPAIAYIDIPLYFYFQGNANSIVKNSTLNIYLGQSKWYLEHLHLFEETDFPLTHAFRGAMAYRYIGSFSANPALVNKNARKCLKICRTALRNNKTMSVKKRVQLLVLSSFGWIYRLALILKDPTYREVERRMRQEHQKPQVLPWEEI